MDKNQTFPMSVIEMSFYLTHCPRRVEMNVRADIWVYVTDAGVIYAAHKGETYRRAVEVQD